MQGGENVPCLDWVMATQVCPVVSAGTDRE